MIELPIYTPSPPNDTEKYQYTKINSKLYKFLVTLQLISWVIFGYNFYTLYHNVFWLFITLGPLILFTIFYNVLSLIINLLYPSFNFTNHYNLIFDFWQTKRTRKITIDVFLPVCGENLEILQNTWAGVYALKSKNYKLTPYVLDDKNDQGVKALAEEFGFTYLSRPNRGELKKAGNLKYGFENSNSDFILILDADFAPRSDFITETLPYMLNENIGIVQTPQYFDRDEKLYRHSPLMYGAGAIQEYFYKIIQPARSVIGGAICVGTCGLYRRKALDLIGGTYQIEHSEDVYTGFALKAKGYDLKYLPLILSKGVCPEDAHAFFKQQTRWCLGSLSLMTNKVFWQAKLSLLTRLCFISGFSFYISNVIGLILTAQTMLTIYIFPDVFNEQFPLYFLYLLLSNFIIQLFYVYQKPNFGTILAHSTASWAYIFTILSLIIGHKEGWTPTGAKSKVSSGFLTQYSMLATYLIISLCAFLYLLLDPRISIIKIGLIPLFFWAGINLIYHFSAWSYWSNYLQESYLTVQKSLLPKFLFNFQKLALVMLALAIVIVGTDGASNKQLSSRFSKPAKVQAYQVDGGKGN